MNATFRFHTLDVFTDRRFGGNPLAVFSDARGLGEAFMQPIARELNLSETVFVLPPRDPRALCRLRIFTPGRELPFAGHPTVGTGHLLATLGRIPGDHARGEATACMLLEEDVGLVPVTVSLRDGRPRFVQLSAAALPSGGPEAPSRTALAAMLSLAAEDILDGADAPRALSCGVPFMFVPLRDRGALARARLDIDRWRTTLERHWANQVFLFCRDPELPGSSIRARMFAPEMGVIEDPATGAACAALAGYLGPREARADGTAKWIVEQGFEMGRPSLIHVEADLRDGAVTAVRVGGTSVMVSEGELRLD